MPLFFVLVPRKNGTMNKKSLLNRFQAFAVCSTILIGGILAFHSEVEAFITDIGEKVYVAIYGEFVARDVQPPSIQRLLD